MRKSLGTLFALASLINPSMGDIRGMGEPIHQPLEPTPRTHPLPSQRDLEKMAAAQEKRRKRAAKRTRTLVCGIHGGKLTIIKDDV